MGSGIYTASRLGSHPTTNTDPQTFKQSHKNTENINTENTNTHLLATHRQHRTPNNGKHDPKLIKTY
jgi:hypothetical protein